MTGIWKGNGDSDRDTFMEGRQFRMYLELDIPPNTALWVRHTSTKNFRLHDQRITIHAGAIRWAAIAAPSSSPGPWTARIMRRRNQMTLQPQPMYISGSVLETSTTLAAAIGGNEVDVMTINAGNGGQSVPSSQNAGKRGLAPNTYHTKLFNDSNVNAKGTYDWWWEELD